VRVLTSRSAPSAGCLTGSVRCGLRLHSRVGQGGQAGGSGGVRAHRGRVLGRQFRSWTEPGSTSEIQTGSPSGRMTACMLPPKSRVLPKYQASIVFPFLLKVFTRSRLVWTILSSRVMCDQSADDPAGGEGRAARLEPRLVVTIVDRGFSSAENLAYLRRAGGHYIAGERMRDGTAHATEALAREGRFQLGSGAATARGLP
jgi:hypothetical protein